jgi:hypothetical protein
MLLLLLPPRRRLQTTWMRNVTGRDTIDDLHATGKPPYSICPPNSTMLISGNSVAVLRHESGRKQWASAPVTGPHGRHRTRRNADSATASPANESFDIVATYTAGGSGTRRRIYNNTASVTKTFLGFRISPVAERRGVCVRACVGQFARTSLSVWALPRCNGNVGISP